jgi:hypothetical protein
MARRNEPDLSGPYREGYTGRFASHLGRINFTTRQAREEARRLPPGAIYQGSWVPPSLLAEPAPAATVAQTAQQMLSPRQKQFALAFAAASQQLADENQQTHIAAAHALRYPRGRADLSPRYHAHFEAGSAHALKPGVRYGWWSQSTAGGGAWGVEESSNARF